MNCCTLRGLGNGSFSCEHINQQSTGPALFTKSCTLGLSYLPSRFYRSKCELAVLYGDNLPASHPRFPAGNKLSCRPDYNSSQLN